VTVEHEEENIYIPESTPKTEAITPKINNEMSLAIAKTAKERSISAASIGMDIELEARPLRLF
jgi:hypothetical protein